MLADGPATEQACDDPDGLAAAGPGLIWVQMATVGIDWTERLANTAGPVRGCASSTPRSPAARDRPRPGS